MMEDGIILFRGLRGLKVSLAAEFFFCEFLLSVGYISSQSKLKLK